MDTEHEYNPYKPGQKRPQQSQAYNNQPRQNYTEQQRQTTQENWNRCPRCGVMANGNFCSNCGLDFRAYYNQQQSQPVHNKPPKKPKKKKVSPLLIIGLVMCLSVTGLLVGDDLYHKYKYEQRTGEKMIKNNNLLGALGVHNFNYLYPELRHVDYCEISEDGKWMRLDTSIGNSDYTAEVLEAIIAVHDKFGLSQTVLERMSKTSAIHGMLSEENEDIKVSWAYHPDEGLIVLYDLK